MRAWRVHGTGEPASVFVEEEVPEPAMTDLEGLGMGLAGWCPPAPGTEPFTDFVIMRMAAAALSLPDVTMARGTYPVPVARPYTSGQEGVGTVIDAPPERRHLVGRRVAAVCIQPFGSLADVAVGVGMIVEVPDSLDDDQAAGFLIPAHTAYHVVHRRGRVQAGETVVVLGAAGGLGAAVVQLAAIAGAHVIAVVGGEEKVRFSLAMGATSAVDHLEEDPVEGVAAVTRDRGVDVVIDPVQGELGGRMRSLLVPDGRHVLCGHAGGLVPIDPHFYVRNHTLVGATLGGYPRPQMQRIHAETDAALAPLLADGRFRPTVMRTVAFADVPAALADLAGRRTIGRVAVRIA